MVTRTIPFYRSIHFRLVMLFALVVLVGAAANAYLTLKKTEREFQRVLADQFTSALAITENAFDLVGQMALISAHHLVTDTRLGPELCSKAVPTEALLQFRGDVGADLLVLVDAEGRIRYHSADPQLIGASQRSSPLVRQAVDAGLVGSAILEDIDNLVIYSSAVRRVGGHPDGKVCGVVLIGHVINDRLIGSLAQNSPVGITVIRRNAVMASTFNDDVRRLARSPVDYVEYQGWLDDATAIRRTRIGERVYFASARRLRRVEPLMEGSLLLTQDETALADIQRGLTRYHVWTFIASLLLIVLVSARFTVQLLKPLRLLLQQSHRSGGRREMKSLVITRRDEIGALARQINRMMVDLRRNNELLERTVADRTAALQDANRRLEEQATHDPLTRLPNRRLFVDRLEQTIRHAARGKTEFALLFVDLDRFKWVNDNYGHAVGDELLKQVGHRLRMLVRQSDTVARLGGDEFTIILDCSGGDAAAGALTVAEKLLARLAEPFVLPGADKPLLVGGSVGIALYPAHATDAESLLLFADTAMYRAKQQGQGSACLFEQEVRSETAD